MVQIVSSDFKNSTVNLAEEFVLRVCQKTCLSLWCYNNPLAEPGKELCDILVVCDPHVIIVSVKDIVLNSEKAEAGYDRWLRKAVDDSVKQIYGAERNLATAPHVIRKDGSPGLTLPDLATRKTHRIAVAFGSKGEIPIASHDFGKGFVHVLHEESFFGLLAELDTITDLVNYLAAKEVFLVKTSVIVEGPEANLLGYYLCNERSFPQQPDFLVIDNTIWSGLQQNPEFQRRKKADVASYAWDQLIEALSDPAAKPISGPPLKLTDLELALREMARENRLSRRILGQAVRVFLEKAKARVLRSRLLVSPDGLIYVLVFFSQHDLPENRLAELGARCCAARQKIGRGETVIGIGLGEHQPGIGSTSDLVYIKMDDWSSIERDETLKSFGYFSKSDAQNVHVDEFPKE